MFAKLTPLANKKGFTLLELLIVISIIAVLSVIIIVVINPAELLKKARDVQRMSDLSTLKTAIGAYMASTSTVYLAGAATNAGCKTGSGGGSYSSGDSIFYSYPSDSPGTTISDTALDGGGTSVPAASQVQNEDLYFIDGTGWLPINLSSIAGGAPISNLPIDPINTISSATAVAASDLVYRYACNATDSTFEFNARLESNTYTVSDNRMIKDGGNNGNYYEVGTNLNILGDGSDF